MRLSSYAVLLLVLALFFGLQGYLLVQTYFLPITLTSTHASLMRTELDIGTPVGGTVKNVRTYENQNVEAGAILLEITVQSVDDPRGSTVYQVRAPRAGIVIDITVEPGEFVQAGSVIAKLIDSDPHAQYIEATFPLAPEDRAKLQRFEHATVQATHLHNGQPLQALVTSVSPLYDSEKQTVDVRLRLQEGFSLEDDTAFVVGLPVTVTLEVENTNTLKTWVVAAIHKFAPASLAEHF